MKKQISSDFNTRQYMQPVDFELFYYNDTTLKSVAAHVHDYYEFYFFLEGEWNTIWQIKAICWNTVTVS